MIAQHVLDEIREKLPMSSLAAERGVKLKRAGREMRGLSPFKAERTPSFFCNDQKRMFFDFASGRSGNIFSFLMGLDNLGFLDAVERCAELAGVRIERSKVEKVQQRYIDLAKAARRALEASQNYFKRALATTLAAQDYARSRGLGLPTIEDMGIGYAPRARCGLRNWLEDQGFSDNAMTEAGVLTGEDDHDFMRERLTIPIHDQRARSVGFGGRTINGGIPKYLNTPATSLFDKGRILFNLDKATLAIRQTGIAIVMEGYLDVITAAQADCRNAVATMGTAIQIGQLHALWKLAPTVAVCFDGDEHGHSATAGVLDAALPALSPDRRLAFVALPSGSDPDTLIRAHGAGAFNELVEQRISASDRIWRAINDQAAGEGADAQAAKSKLIDEMCGVIADMKMREAYKRDLHKRLRGHRASYLDKAIPGREAALVYAAATHIADYVEPMLERFASVNFTNAVTSRVATQVLNSASTGDSLTCERDLAVLSQSLPQPAPSFVTTVNCASFSAALDVQVQQQARKRLREPST